MKRFIEGEDRTQVTLLPECLDDYVTTRVAGMGEETVSINVTCRVVPASTDSFTVVGVHRAAGAAFVGVDRNTTKHVMLRNTTTKSERVSQWFIVRSP